MPFLAECPLCDTEVRFTEKPAAEARCPQCQTVMVVNAEAIPEKEWVVEHAAEQGAASPKRRRRWAVAVGGLLLAAGAAFGVYQSVKPKADPRLASLDIGEWPDFPLPEEIDPERVITIHLEAPDELSGAWLDIRVGRLPAEGIRHSRRGLRQTWVMKTAADPRAFASLIDFGKVRRVENRTITVLGASAPGLPGPEADRISQALFAMRLDDQYDFNLAFDLLANESPADPRREEVANVLMNSMESRGGFSFHDSKARRTIQRWATPAELARLAAGDKGFTSHDITEHFLTRIDEPAVRAALLSLDRGRQIEWAVLRRLSDPDDRIVIGACEILREVGTEFFSGKHLQNVATTAKSPAVQAAAKDAIAAITSREKEKAPR